MIDSNVTPVAAAIPATTVYDPAPPPSPGCHVTVQAMVHTHATVSTMTDRRDRDWPSFDTEVSLLSSSLSFFPCISSSPPFSLFSFSPLPLTHSLTSQVRASEKQPQTTGSASQSSTPCVRPDDTTIAVEGASPSGHRTGFLIPHMTSIGFRNRTSIKPRSRVVKTEQKTTTSIDITKGQLSDEAEAPPRPPDPHTSLLTPTRRPTKHITTSRKLQDWSLCMGKKWLIISDSNLARFSPFSNQDLQMDSYPGATFHHTEAILKKAACSIQVDTEPFLRAEQQTTKDPGYTEDIT